MKRTPALLHGKLPFSDPFPVRISPSSPRLEKHQRFRADVFLLGGACGMKLEPCCAIFLHERMPSISLLEIFSMESIHILKLSDIVVYINRLTGENQTAGIQCVHGKK
jgi:hypothetical protein